MLDVHDEETLKRQWQSLASRTLLPVSWQRYLSQPLPDRVVPVAKRRFVRASLKSIAILIEGERAHAIYLKDVSRLGLGFYAPVNILPRKPLALLIPGRKTLHLRAVRCRRLGEKYYECGAKFEAIPSSDPGRRTRKFVH
jgi:hypothetical protein